jgi:hypothetical protein
MERITTPTAVPNKFGPGKNGFQGGGPPNATQLSPEWFDNVQEETARVIEGQGIVLDGGQLDQMKQAIDDYAFADPSITGTLTIENLASIEVESGGAINVQSGGAINAMVGSTVALQGTFQITPSATYTCDTNATYTKDMLIGDTSGDALIITSTTTFQSQVFVNDNIDMAGSTAISGGAGSSCTFPLIDASTGVLRALLTEWTAVGGAPSTDDGEVQWDGYRLSLGNGTSDQPVYAPFEKYIASNSTAAVLADIVNLSVTLTIPKDREVLIELVANQKVSLAGDIPKLEIRAVNDLGADPVAQLNGAAADAAISPLPATVANNDRRPNSITIKWKPSNDIPAPANDIWTIQAEHGVTGGALLTSTNCNLRVTYK